MAARRELLECIENESKAYGSDFGSHYLPTWQEFETAVRSLWSQYVLISFSLCHYRASTIDKLFSFKNVGSAIPGGLPRAWQKMMQRPRCTPVPELKQDIVWNIPLLSCSWKWYNVLQTELVCASWAYLRSSYVNTALPLRLWRSWSCPRCCSDAFNCFTMHSCYDSTSA